MSNLAVGISIGAVLAGSFEQAVSSAPKKLAKIGNALAAVRNKDSKLKLFEGAELDLEAARTMCATVNKLKLNPEESLKAMDMLEAAGKAGWGQFPTGSPILR